MQDFQTGGGRFRRDDIEVRRLWAERPCLSTSAPAQHVKIDDADVEPAPEVKRDRGSLHAPPHLAF